MTNHRSLTVREYLRVSHDGSGRERSNEEQHADHLRFVERHRDLEWSGLPEYRDVGSASKYARKARAGFDNLMSDLAAGTFGADVLLVWVNSRGSRKPEEIMDLLRRCDRAGVKIAVERHDRIYDVANTHDWANLMRDAIEDKVYSDKISESVCRATAANANEGRPNGGKRAYGYTSGGWHLAEWEAEPGTGRTEADVIREAVRRVLGGVDNPRSIAADFNRRGILTSEGNAWHPGVLSNVVGGPRIAGIRVHRGRYVETPGQWPAIITRDEHHRVKAVLASRTPHGRRGRTPWLLHGILRCELCGAVLVSQQDTRGIKSYICRKGPGYKGCGGLMIRASHTEELLGLLATGRLRDAVAHRAAQADHTDEDDAAELATLNRIAAQRVEIADAYAAGDLSLKQRAEDVAALDRAESAANARLAAKVREVRPLDFVSSEGFVGREWSDLSPEDQRRVVVALIDHVTVGPNKVKGSRLFDPTRVDGSRIAWKV